MADGKSHRLKAGEDMVVAKGKGEMKTYWLDPTKKRRHTKNHQDIRVQQEFSWGYGSDPMSAGELPFDEKYACLIEWNVDVFLHHLAHVIYCRSRSVSRGSLVNHSSEVALLSAAINDVAEIVALPPFDPDASRFRRARPDVSMLQQTRSDLHEYVKAIASMYRDVPFHNFEHASHVPLSLIHDDDHRGLPNAQLVKDTHELARKFDNRSAAEQNSVHLGWELLMDPRFERRKGRQVVQEMFLLHKDVDEDDQSGSSMDSENESHDLEYDSPGALSFTDSDGDETNDRDIGSMDPVQT